MIWGPRSAWWEHPFRYQAPLLLMREVETPQSSLISLRLSRVSMHEKQKIRKETCMCIMQKSPSQNVTILWSCTSVPRARGTWCALMASLGWHLGVRTMWAVEQKATPALTSLALGSLYSQKTCSHQDSNGRPVREQAGTCPVHYLYFFLLMLTSLEEHWATHMNWERQHVRHWKIQINTGICGMLSSGSVSFISMDAAEMSWRWWSHGESIFLWAFLHLL